MCWSSSGFMDDPSMSMNPDELQHIYKALAFKLGSLLNPKIMIQCCELDQSLQFNLRVDAQWIINFINRKTDGQLASLVNDSEDPESASSSKQNLSWTQTTSKDFFGLWKQKSIGFIKQQTLEQYRYIFRFSVERLAKMVEDKLMMMIIFQYLAESQMQRVHYKSQMRTNSEAYYRAMENLINASLFKP